MWFNFEVFLHLEIPPTIQKFELLVAVGVWTALTLNVKGGLNQSARGRCIRFALNFFKQLRLQLLLQQQQQQENQRPNTPNNCFKKR